MMAIAHVLLAAASLLLSGLATLASTVFLVEIIASFWATRSATNSTKYPSVVVLIPAHNESSGLLPTLASIIPQLRKADRCLVVADNCTDDTPLVAKEAGVEVIERHDASRLGKGYALDYGIRYLQSSPPSILIIIDADCTISDNALSILATKCQQYGRPTQALDIMIAPADASPALKVGEFAWQLKNHARPLGLTALGMPCQLMGTGMAFPWPAISAADIASGNIVEDLKLGLELAEAGYPALFCPAAVVTSKFPTDNKAARMQRQRWEQGHLNTIFRSTPRLLVKALLSRKIDLCAIALDLFVPPLSVLASVLLLGLILSLAATATGSSKLLLIVTTLGGLEFLVALVIGWWRYGRESLPAKSLHLILHYLAGKATMYVRFLFHGGASNWNRTDRK